MDRQVTLVGLVACTAHVALDDLLTQAVAGSSFFICWCVGLVAWRPRARGGLACAWWTEPEPDLPKALFLWSPN